MSSYLHCRKFDLGIHLTESPSDISGVVSVCLIDILRFLPDFDALMSLLNNDERKKAGYFRMEPDRNRFVISRAILKLLLSKRLSCSHKDLTLRSGIHGKPRLHPENALQFNVSHSVNKAAIVISEKPVGIDVEYINADFDYWSITDHTFSVAEMAYLRLSSQPLQDFYELWTRKEAFLKAVGTGLINDLKLVPSLTGIHTIPENIHSLQQDWTVNSTTSEDNYIISVAHQRYETPLLLELYQYGCQS